MLRWSKLSSLRGTNGAFNFFSFKSFHGKLRNQGWFLMSVAPSAAPSRFCGLRYIIYRRTLASFTYPVNEICGFNWPAERNLISFYLNLFRKDMVANFFPRFAKIGPPSKHALVGNYPHCEVVYWASMILTAHHFRRHVSWSARGVLGIIFAPNSCDSKVGNSKVAVWLNNQIFRLDVSVDDIFVVDVLEASDKTSHEETSGFFFKFTVSTNMVSQIATC